MCIVKHTVNMLIFLGICIDILIKSLSNGDNIDWTFGKCSSPQFGYLDNKISRQRCCNEESKILLKCKDKTGQGWQGGDVQINGNLYCGNNTAWKYEKTELIELLGTSYDIFVDKKI